jgi:NADPH2 dehydrogenase
MTSALFAPARLAGLDLANRIVVSPMCQYSAVDGSAQPWHRVHLGSLALSGVGLVILEATAVERSGRITHGCLGLYSDENEAALAAVLADVRAVGRARIGIQLAHAGRKASSQRPWEGGDALAANADPWPVDGASAIAFGPGRPVPHELDAAGLALVRDAFVMAARRADRLGIDLIELHGAHGYLLHSFVSPLSNQRTDRYGGSLENRMRFPLEVAAAVRAVWPREKPLGMRITGSDWHEDGLTQDDAVTFAQALERAGLDFVVVSSGGAIPGIKIPLKPGYQVPFAAAVKQATSLKVMAVGLITDPHHANDIVANGQADYVALARALLDDPRWPWRAAAALGDKVPYPPQYDRVSPKLWPGAVSVVGLRPGDAKAKSAAE